MARFGAKEVCDVIFYDLAQGGKPVLFLDSLKLSNLTNNADTSYVQGGKGNPRIMSFDFNRTAQFDIQDALMNPSSIAMQVGKTIVKGATTAHKREVLTAVASATTGKTEVTLAKAPLVGSMTVYATTDGYEHGTVVVPSTVASVTQFSNTDVVAGSQVIVYYQYTTGANSEQIIVSSDKYSAFYKIVGLSVIRNASTNQDEAFEIVIPKAKIMSEWSLNLTPEGDPAVFDMKLDIYKDSASTDMVRLTRIQ